MRKPHKLKIYNFNIRAAVSILITMMAIIAVQILISVATASGAYEIAALKQTNKDLGLVLQQLNQETAYLDSPQYLSTQAEKLGMVMSTSPVFLRLSDATVIGTPTPASPNNTLQLQNEVLVPNYLETRYASANNILPEEAIINSEVSEHQQSDSSKPIRLKEGELLPAPQTR